MYFQRNWISCFILISTIICVVDSVAYDVHWLGGATTIERDYPSSKQPVDIYCYSGTPKSLLTLWQTVKFHVKIKNDEFSQYVATTPEDVAPLPL